jgi:hypothetical protein
MSAVVYFRVGSSGLAFGHSPQITVGFALGFLAPRLWKAVDDWASVSVEASEGQACTPTPCMFPVSVPHVARAIKKIFRQSGSISSVLGAS